MIIANMIARNEEDNYLVQVLDRLSQQVDIICFTDDHSDDNTAEIARDFGAEVQVMSEPTFIHDESRIRQASWHHLERFVSKPDDTMILAIDADEELYMTGPTLETLTQQEQWDVFNVTFFHMWNETHYRVDKAWRPHPSSRLFRYRPNGKFKERRLACGSEPTFVVDSVNNRKMMMHTGLAMKHLSYVKDEDKQKKYERYAELDCGAFHAGAHIQSIIDSPGELVLEEWTWG